jgi:hypothetical protein
VLAMVGKIGSDALQVGRDFRPSGDRLIRRRHGDGVNQVVTEGEEKQLQSVRCLDRLTDVHAMGAERLLGRAQSLRNLLIRIAGQS